MIRPEIQKVVDSIKKTPEKWMLEYKADKRGFHYYHITYINSKAPVCLRQSSDGQYFFADLNIKMEQEELTLLNQVAKEFERKEKQKAEEKLQTESFIQLQNLVKNLE